VIFSLNWLQEFSKHLLRCPPEAYIAMKPCLRKTFKTKPQIATNSVWVKYAKRQIAMIMIESTNEITRNDCLVYERGTFSQVTWLTGC
jgi:hypothetical protein